MSARHSKKSGSSTAPRTGAELLQESRSELDAIPDADVLTPRVDVAVAATTAIGVMPKIEAHRPALEALFDDRAKSALDGLVPAARLVLAADAMWVIATEKDLEAEAERLRATRDRLSSAATVLVERGLVSAKSLQKLAGGSSYLALARDTQALATWFTVLDDTARAAVKLTADELGAAYQAAMIFSGDVAERDRAQAGTGPAADDRARAFTLFFRTYDGVRKMLTYLRWHEGDVDEIAPSLFARGRASHRDASDLPPVVSAPARPVSPGMPGGSPFVG